MRIETEMGEDESDIQRLTKPSWSMKDYIWVSEALRSALSVGQ
ncbi:hypothetical protein FOXG_18050 [Fusarium oxysporum f. sp. lycopersici 4287]|uniref:Uncharacterized protein n=5 Tax=Fusarium oxysporum TaxID=5507 RepID=W9ICV2_FUSOX|nr:hypothetical protein FOXG_18050 [Fusarium oxysporum f. sp. lycopersici 4287]EWY92452.1 hypothetical protein FOYG_06005 [Fusarium oxysporum NRRL 32931]EWZ86701.1 hypothetical protein FOWG_10238 [Fusarium oxysporum f. sp. lycopersici MN25]EXA51497.1 hypothetical protein FOVG_00122 [Fusarium oxysporum f. sp. pisi HDV247]EXK49556.1 hypothetical protein FOMG_02070 [Fusarium oxysporum f. sp. melonis 26406]EXM18935.1 hypothetical protein FOTG_12934 [Fusarium oxysporum f. sp. vasinfectum 25433]KAI